MKKFNPGKYHYLLIFALFFVVGIYLWKIFNKDYFHYRSDSTARKITFGHQKLLLQVGDAKITQDDVDWEVKLHMAGDMLPSNKGAAGTSDNGQSALLLSLREKLMASLVERKLLYKYIQQEGRMNLADPSLYVDCMNEWQSTLREATEITFNQNEREKLKNYLCEKSILEQYLEKFVFSTISITESDIADYYKSHSEQFKKPKRVTIRQIVAASETDAKNIQSKVRANNFAEYAIQYSITPESENGGKLGPFSKGEMPQVFDVVFSMEPGQLSTILKSTYGYHIIMLEKVLPESVMSLTGARKEIEKSLMRTMKEQEYKKLVELALDVIHVGAPRSIL